MSGQSQRAEELRKMVRDAISGVDSVDRIDALINSAMAEIGTPTTVEVARSAAEIARHAVTFLHDRAANPEPRVGQFMRWIEKMVEDDDLRLREEYVLLLEAIDSGKRDDPHGVTSAAGRALVSSGVDPTLEALRSAPAGNSDAAALAAVQLRCLAEYVRALRLIPASDKAVREAERMANLLERFEVHAGKLSAFAMYRARLAVAYGLRDLNGRWSDAGTLLARAQANRERDGRTALTDDLHHASAIRLEGATAVGGWSYQLGQDIIANARALEDRCLDGLLAAGFRRHDHSFRRFRQLYLDPS
jgi:hypothetical protein